MTRAVIVVAGGPTPPPAVAERLPAAHAVVAADSGVDNALELGLEPTVVVGDLDSVSPAGRRWVYEHEVVVHRHPPDKDATDLELALSVASTLGVDIVVVDSGTGRLDHALANALLLGADVWADLRIAGFIGEAKLTVVRGRRELVGAPGDMLTLLPVGGVASGVTTEGLSWPLHDATIQPGSTIGVSNVFVEADAAVTVTSGVLFAVQPGPE